jgi:hypothetical protein
MELRAATGIREATDAADVVARMMAGYDPALVSASDAMALVKVFNRIKRLGAAGEMLSAGRVSETELWRGKGHRSAANWMAGETGVGVVDAVRVLETAKALEHAEATADAFKAGELSPRQAQVIAETAAEVPGAERELLAAADRLTIRELDVDVQVIHRSGGGAFK